MNITARPSRLSGHITVPGSKSHTIRALILASLAEGTSRIHNPLPSNDCLSTARAVNQIGAQADISDGATWVVKGAGKNLHIPGEQIDVGNSGSLMYFLAPVLATLGGECTFTGDESICTRPVGHLLDALNQLGARAESLRNNDRPPFRFAGPLDATKTLFTDGRLSQYISGFMMAATRTDGGLHMELSDPKETPYLTMTRLWLESTGAKVSVSPDFKRIFVDGPHQIPAFERTIPSDWEGVAFPLIAALASKSTVTIDNVDGSGSQGDDKIVEVLQSAGADILWDKENGTLQINGDCDLSTKHLADGELRVNISGFPDAICALTVIACFIEGKTVITDVEICRKKETDRVKAMISELTKLGARLEEGDDCLIIHGKKDGTQLHGGSVESYKDHRIVMALSCLGLGLQTGQQLTVSDAEWCSVTFPGFFEAMRRLGADFAE